MKTELKSTHENLKKWLFSLEAARLHAIKQSTSWQTSDISAAVDQSHSEMYIGSVD